LRKLWEKLFGKRGGSSTPTSLAGSWHVVEIAEPHPFGQYTMHLLPDGKLEWTAVVPTTDAGEFRVSGSGSWFVEGGELHYTSGDGRGALQWSHEDGNLVLDGLPATKVGPGVRCVLERR